MIYRLLADGVLVFHLLFVLFVLLGGLIVVRWPRVAWLHLPAAAWGMWIEFSGSICPLTPLEQHWRQFGGQGGYEGGFIDHYVVAWLYPTGLTRTDQLLLGLAVLAISAGAYYWTWRRHRATVAARTR